MNAKEYKTKELWGRFTPYFRKYYGTLARDLFCAALTTVCELVLPMIMRYITNVGIRDLAALTIGTVGRLGGIYLVLRIVDCIAAYYMANMGHVMGARIETDMRRDAYAHLQKLSDTYYNNTKVGQIMGRITNDLFDVTEFSHHCPEEFFYRGNQGSDFLYHSGADQRGADVDYLCGGADYGGDLYGSQSADAGGIRKQRVQIGELNARIEDSLLGQKVVKAFTNEEKEKEKSSGIIKTFFLSKGNL